MSETLQQYFCKGVLLNEYYALFDYYLSHALICWGSSSYIYRLFGLQRKCTGIVKFDFGDHDRCKFKELGILIISSIYIIRNLNYIKIIY